ncbi:hypothetical protein [Streptomyces sp. NPDC088261]|uniref:hypothetical protein n=1 Tax=Streptomyces sp. NPDC088261 TaxID=3365851 RepID=UPI0038257CF9
MERPDEVSHTLDELDRWLREHAPGDYGQLLPPADPDAIAELAAGRVRAHDDVLAWLSRHDGSQRDPRLAAGAFIPRDFPLLGAVGMTLGLADMAEAVEQAVEDGDEEFVVGVEAHTHWLPVARNHTGGLLVVDHRPGEGYGAVLEVDPSVGVNAVRRWDSPRQMFTSVLAALRDGSPVTSGSGVSAVPLIEEPNEGLPHVRWEPRYRGPDTP